MKKIYVGIAIALLCSSAQAQYKKASFLTKSGRTYDLGVAGHFLNDGAGTRPGIYYSYGRDKGTKVFHWFDLELLLPTTFKYNTVDKEDPQTIVSVTGKSKLGLAYRYNFAYYVANTENSDAKIKPFVTAGINFLLVGAGAKTYAYTPEESDPVKVPHFEAFSCGANIGAGGIYAFSETVGLKFTAGYNFQTQIDTDQYSKEYTAYKTFTNHPYVTFGVRFLMGGDE